MGDKIARTSVYKHVIREDHTIRIATKQEITLQDGEHVVLSPTLFRPGKFVYSVKESRLVPISLAVLAQRKDRRQAIAQTKKDARDVKLARLKTAIGKAPKTTTQPALLLMAELLGLELPED